MWTAVIASYLPLALVHHHQLEDYMWHNNIHEQTMWLAVLRYPICDTLLFSSGSSSFTHNALPAACKNSHYFYSLKPSHRTKVVLQRVSSTVGTVWRVAIVSLFSSTCIARWNCKVPMHNASAFSIIRWYSNAHYEPSKIPVIWILVITVMRWFRLFFIFFHNSLVQ
jgi:hypothetical protein